VGLAEHEWIATLVTVNEDQLEYEDFVACGRRLATHLREEEAGLVALFTTLLLCVKTRLN
jgi:5'-nucleotidase